MGIRKRIKDPLLGFGWAGYVLAGILLALITALVGGIELRYELLKLIVNTLGVDAMMFFVSHLPFAGFSIFGVSISVTTGAAALIAFNVAPYRISPVIQLAIFLLCTAWFLISMECVRVFGRWLSISIFGFSISVYSEIEIFGAILVGFFAFRLCRSGFVAAMWVMAIALAAIHKLWIDIFGTYPPGSVILVSPFDRFEYRLFSLVFDLLTMGSLLLWAILERRRIVHDQVCHSCGYDLAGLSGDAPCPECGRE